MAIKPIPLSKKETRLDLSEYVTELLKAPNLSAMATVAHALQAPAATHAEAKLLYKRLPGYINANDHRNAVASVLALLRHDGSVWLARMRRDADTVDHRLHGAVEQLDDQHEHTATHQHQPLHRVLADPPGERHQDRTQRQLLAEGGLIAKGGDRPLERVTGGVDQVAKGCWGAGGWRLPTAAGCPPGVRSAGAPRARR